MVALADDAAPTTPKTVGGLAAAFNEKSGAAAGVAADAAVACPKPGVAPAVGVLPPLRLKLNGADGELTEKGPLVAAAVVVGVATVVTAVAVLDGNAKEKEGAGGAAAVAVVVVAVTCCGWATGEAAEGRANEKLGFVVVAAADMAVEAGVLVTEVGTVVETAAIGATEPKKLPVFGKMEDAGTVAAAEELGAADVNVAVVLVPNNETVVVGSAAVVGVAIEVKAAEAKAID